MFNAFARREAVEKLRKSLAEHETLRQEVEQASVRLFEQRQRAVAEVVEPVESYVNRLARSPKEFDRSVREYRIEIDRFKSTVRRIETEAKRSEAIGGGAGVAGVMAGGGMAAFGPTVAMAVATDFRHGVDGNRHLCRCPALLPPTRPSPGWAAGPLRRAAVAWRPDTRSWPWLDRWAGPSGASRWRVRESISTPATVISPGRPRRSVSGSKGRSVPCGRLVGKSGDSGRVRGRTSTERWMCSLGWATTPRTTTSSSIPAPRLLED